MRIKRILAVILTVAMTLSAMMLPTSVFAADDAPDYGKAASTANSTVLYFGADSVTASKGGGMKEDTVTTSAGSITTYRTENLKADATLTLSSVDLSGKGYDKVDLCVASKNDTAVVVKVGDTEVATFDNANTGSWDNYSSALTAELNAAAATASGNVTLNITGSGYCGNYVYIKFYNSQTGGSELPTPTAEPIDPSTLLPYQNTELSFEERAADLVSRMTLEEKVAQLGKDAPAIERLGVSKYSWWKECLHGVARQGQATSFPTSLSLSNTWNRELFYDVAWATSDEARAKNNRYNLSYYTPTINMARDPRWGRNDETYGEDPYLTGELGAEFVKGMEGQDEKYKKIIATIKHFATNNNETNRRGGSSVLTEFNLRNYYTKAFQTITEEVMPGSVMSSYNGITLYRNGELLYNYKPSAANYYLITELLRRNWGFNGYITTDCGAGEDMTTRVSQYQIGMLGEAGLAPEAYIADALKAGMDLECNLGGGNKTQTHGVDAVLNGYITEEELETNVYNLFLQRFKTGEFDDNATTYRDKTTADIESDEHVALAEKAAEESWVLLENNGILPFKSDVKNVAIVGSFAGEVFIGDYSGEPKKTKTPYEGIKEELTSVNPDATLNYLGATPDDADIMNVKSLTVVYSDGKTAKIDLSKAENVSGMTSSNGTFTSVTPKATAVLKKINLENAVSIKAETSTNAGSLGGTIVFNYETANGPQVASIECGTTGSVDTYAEFTGAYTGSDGGYGGADATLYFTIVPTSKTFTVDNFKDQLDAADVIIAYAGTNLSDSSESNDRKSIDLPSHESHVKAIANAYPEKTVIAMSTVGQINVEDLKDKCGAMLWTSYNGQTQGTALGKVLTGQVNPSGKLTTTWYKNEDLKKMELSGTSKKIGDITGPYTNYDIQKTDTVDGRSYMYYEGTPVYPFGYGLSYTDFAYSNLNVDKTEVDANGELTVSIDVENTGTVAGQEIVQLYIKHPGSDTDTLLPNKQLKEFTKTSLEAGEKKTVEFKLNVKDFNLFSEADQKLYVPNGEYKIFVGKNADDLSNIKSVNVTGTLNSTLKTVNAIPNGITLNGLIQEDGEGLTSVTTIDPRLSAIMSDEVWVDLEKDATVKYTSANTNVATVDEKTGIVSSGKENGVTTITVEVTVDGVTKTDSFPVVNELKIKPTADDIANAKAELKSAFDKLPKTAYSDANWAEIEKAYNDALANFETVSTKDDLEIAIPKAINAINSVEMDALTANYSILSENENYIKNGMIDYTEGGIPMYDGAEGTITNATPFSGIQLQVKDAEGNVVDNSKIVWQIKKFDDSVRKVADIDEDGKLTVYGNGIVQITAANMETMTCGRLMVQINMQIEAEYADESNGATLNDSQNSPSGGFNAGSTGDAWMVYKSVKLTNLESIEIRYAGKNSTAVNISLDKNTNPENLIANKTVDASGGWGTWTTTELTLNQENLDAAFLAGKFDDYGCATIYVQTNGTNLDYIRFNYIENNDDVPYVVEKLLNKTNGRVKAKLSYRGSTLATEAVMVSVVKDESGVVKNVATVPVKGSGEYEISTGAESGENVTVYIWDSMSNLLPLSEPVETIWNAPVDSKIVVYSLNSKYSDGNDYSKLQGGNDGDLYTTTINGLCGYGGWKVANKSATITYADVNEKEYSYSFTQGWQAGAGGAQKRSLFFTPTSKCNVTVVFAGAKSRDMYIQQGDEKITGVGVDGQITTFSYETDDTTNPVYVYGGSSNKQLLAIIVEYYGMGGSASTADDARQD